jgi:hypothetical protein
MSAGPSLTWAHATLRRFPPRTGTPGGRVVEGRIQYEQPLQAFTYAAAENLAHFGFATTVRRGHEGFSCMLTAKGEAELERLLEAAP